MRPPAIITAMITPIALAAAATAERIQRGR
jgi:hypothetical protein